MAKSNRGRGRKCGPKNSQGMVFGGQAACPHKPKEYSIEELVVMARTNDRGVRDRFFALFNQGIKFDRAIVLVQRALRRERSVMFKEMMAR